MSPFCSLSSRLAGIVRGARGVLAELGPKGLATGPVLVAIHRCIERRLARFARLMARLEAGRGAVVRRQASVEARGMDEVKRKAGARRPSLVPRGHAWAVKMAQGAAAYGSQLQAMLAEPGVMEMLAGSAEAGAILRPLCRMLATSIPDALQPEGWAPKVARPPAPVRRRWPVGTEGLRFNAKRERFEHFVVRDYFPRSLGRWPPR